MGCLRGELGPGSETLHQSSQGPPEVPWARGQHPVQTRITGSENDRRRGPWAGREGMGVRGRLHPAPRAHWPRALGRITQLPEASFRLCKVETIKTLPSSDGCVLCGWYTAMTVQGLCW